MIISIGTLFIYGLILTHIQNDIYKLAISVFLCAYAINQKEKEKTFLLFFICLADYFLTMSCFYHLGILCFIFVQSYFLNHSYNKNIFFILFLPIPWIYRLVFIYLILLIKNIYKNQLAITRLGFILLLISDLFIGLYTLYLNVVYLYGIWLFYVPSLYLLFYGHPKRKNNLIKMNYSYRRKLKN